MNRNHQIPEHIKLEDGPCPLGCPKDDEVYLRGFDRAHHLPGLFTIVRCRRCGLLRTNPRPTLDTIKFYYPENYEPYQNTIVKNAGIDYKTRQKQMRQWVIDCVLRTHTTITPNIKPGRLLEIGCASGAYLYRMAQRGWQVEGIEFAKTAGSRAAQLGFPVHIGSIESAPEPKQKYDLITAWMVIEHLHDPISTLKRLTCWINPGGWLAFSIPNIAAPWHKLAGNAAYDLFLPIHMHHFSPHTIKRTLNVSGWELKKIYHQKTVRTIMPTLSYLLEDHLKKKNRLTEWLAKASSGNSINEILFYPLSFLLGITGSSGRITVWAQRKFGPEQVLCEDNQK